MPLIGPDLALLDPRRLRGRDATLNRFFAFHVIAIPLVLLGLVAAHIMALHEVGSNNPDGVEIKEARTPDGHPLDGIPFHPYYTVKDTARRGGVPARSSAAIDVLRAGDRRLLPRVQQLHPRRPAEDAARTSRRSGTSRPYYSILRATTTEFHGLRAMASSALCRHDAPGAARLVRCVKVAHRSSVIAGRDRAARCGLDAKFWGVVLMGASTLIFFCCRGSTTARSSRSATGPAAQVGAGRVRRRVPRPRLLRHPARRRLSGDARSRSSARCSTSPSSC